ncbi:hypothetical protein LDENG_00222150 [Lucifuga dentata]|nr:hypothetical protein LDENG_00222150 [Lucifuga dentata]
MVSLLSPTQTGPLQPSSWIKPSPAEDQILCVQLQSADSVDVKTEVSGEECGSEPSWNLDACRSLEADCDVRLLADGFESEDSSDWTEAAGLQKPEETQEAERQSSSTNKKSKRSAKPPQEQKSSDQLPPALSCKVCRATFQKRSVLLTHAAVHARDCGVCGKHLEDTETLKLHLRVHREAAFGCSVCGQSFTLRGNLRTHMRIHSGERPYGCTICGKSFNRRATLVRHVRSHTGEKPFTCSYCGRGFVEKGNLTVHLRTHTGERPYWCLACNRRFSQLSCFYRHPCQRSGPALTNHT